MSVLRGDWEAGKFPHSEFKGAKHPCFLCGEPVGTEMVIHWMGTTGQIYLHPDCVPSLCRRLLMDWEFTKGFLKAGENINIPGLTKG